MFNNITVLQPSPIFAGYDGFWGPPTATLDWCEENYIVTYYLAELWNSMSNLCFILWPLTGVYTCWKLGSELRFYLAYAALMLVGTGSFMFHGTLTYEMQLLDELPMVLALCFLFYCHLQMWSKPNTHSIPLILTLTAVFTTIVAIYVYINIPIFFQVSFGALAVLQAGTGLLNTIKVTRIFPHTGINPFRVLICGCSAMIVATLLWHNDQIHCESIQHHRNVVGYPFRVVLELHAWWHLLSGFAAFSSVMGAQYGRLLALGRKDVGVHFVLGFLPICVEMEKSNMGKKIL